ncbi:LTA synthase family protein [Aquibacillus sp. 3ASR75-11]|uniref:LTA synthase family protein n=1 Tax=Terrihalobacillus insolitus TaxID=2950438 RepID=A0A9X3WUB8_9BACI|nr:LTA synthase family protein [Terrihalobacillus insolitus]MDC3413395.1 LTA synthase family protein [Terrihalobacillus insolitus]MDC3424978.1 LTA synthase family protein [Terrihalobacillus insolitus]
MFQKRFTLPLYQIAALLFGLKTYIMYRFMFNISLDNTMQEFILFINAIVSAILFFTLSVWFKERRQMKFIRYGALIGTLILFFNLVFYRNFNDFITIPVLFQGSNAADLGSSILTLIKWTDVLLFTDVVIIWYLSKKHVQTLSVQHLRKGKIAATAFAIALLAGNFVLAEIERPQLFQRSFDREYLVKNIGLFNYHIYDAVLNSKAQTKRVFADGNELTEIKDYINENVKSNEQSDLFGIAKGKNVIFISVESFQSFVINNELYGEEVTPFLNELIKEDSSLYFENFYNQVAQGRTSDSEFLVENSLYPLPSGAVFFTNAQNEYNAMPEILGDYGYYSSVLHANNKSFWNRDIMYKNLGYDYFYGEEAFEVTEENSIGWGLKDKPLFEQSMKYLQSMEQPFYTKFITLTNHFPFELDEEDATIERYDSNSNTLNNYFQTIRYTDEAIKQFFDQLKASGLYEDSIIVIMGDHFGISENHNQAMSQYLGKEITPYEQTQLQRVPFIINIPGYDGGKVISDIAGQIDVKPTLLNLLGIQPQNNLGFGIDLLGKQKEDFVAFRNGEFVSDDYVYSSGTCYDRQTGEALESQSDVSTQEKPSNVCGPIKKQVEKELSYSDEIIYGDLFRFYNFENK